MSVPRNTSWYRAATARIHTPAPSSFMDQLVSQDVLLASLTSFASARPESRSPASEKRCAPCKEASSKTKTSIIGTKKLTVVACMSVDSLADLAAFQSKCVFPGKQTHGGTIVSTACTNWQKYTTRAKLHCQQSVNSRQIFLVSAIGYPNYCICIW